MPGSGSPRQPCSRASAAPPGPGRSPAGGERPRARPAAPSRPQRPATARREVRPSPRSSPTGAGSGGSRHAATLRREWDHETLLPAKSCLSQRRPRPGGGQRPGAGFPPRQAVERPGSTPRLRPLRGADPTPTPGRPPGRGARRPARGAGPARRRAALALRPRGNFAAGSPGPGPARGPAAALSLSPPPPLPPPFSRKRHIDPGACPARLPAPQPLTLAMALR